MRGVIYARYSSIGQREESVEGQLRECKALDDGGKLELCGAFKGYPGVAGMLILKVQSYEDAEAICKAEPFVAEGYATYELRILRAGNRENNYLL